ncbi:MAG: hypothetical protein K0S78_3788, partial [Thermomicrobiales bacterium]|nr:hypothetical protein [Thermomicrobiales bacterium]
CAIEPQGDAALAGRGGQTGDIEELARAVEHRRQQGQRNIFIERGDNRIFVDRAPIVRGDEDEIALSVAAVEADEAL